jgi:hypothetical protein
MRAPEIVFDPQVGWAPNAAVRGWNRLPVTVEVTQPARACGTAVAM